MSNTNGFSTTGLKQKQSETNSECKQTLFLLSKLKWGVVLFSNFYIFKIVTVTIFRINFNGVLVKYHFIILWNKKLRIFHKQLFYIKISYSRLAWWANALTQYQEHSYTYEGVNCLFENCKLSIRLFSNVVVCIYRHWFHWTAVWLQLHVSLVQVSACPFGMSQASDLAFLVGSTKSLILFIVRIQWNDFSSTNQRTRILAVLKHSRPLIGWWEVISLESDDEWPILI